MEEYYKLHNKMNEYTPLVSIVCITYNHNSYIRQCIDGFLMQKTTFRFEIVINDDASTDNTDIIIQEYVEKYPNLIIPIFQKENQYSQGINPGFEFVFPKCRGKYIAICEGDDYWMDPLKLQKQIDFLEKNEEYGLVYCDADKLYDKTKIIEKNSFKSKIGIIKNTFDDFLMNAWFLAPCTWVIRSKTLDNIKSQLNNKYIVGDLPLLLGISGISKIGYINESMAVYRVLSNSASHFKDHRKQSEFQIGIFKIRMDFAHKYNAQLYIINDIKNKFYPAIFTYACLYNIFELKNEAYIYLNKNKLLSKKRKIIFHVTKYKIIRSSLFMIQAFLKKKLNK
jgi:glycosyltransferase involved in cell wall biosynthesis